MTNAEGIRLSSVVSTDPCARANSAKWPSVVGRPVLAHAGSREIDGEPAREA